MKKTNTLESCICRTYNNVFHDVLDKTKRDILLYLSQRECIALTGEPMASEAPLSSWHAYIVKNVILQYGSLSMATLKQMIPGPMDLEAIKNDAEKIRPYDAIWDMYYDEFEDG